MRVPFDANGIKQVTRKMNAALADIGGANSPELKAAAGTLAKSIRKVLSVSGGGTQASSIKTRRRRVIGGRPSTPGQPPHKQTGRLSRSVKHGPVGAGRRVGVLAFYAGFQEEGVPKRRLGRRPFMLVAYERVKDQMGDMMVIAMDPRLDKLAE